MKFKVGDTVVRIGNRNLKFKVTYINYDDVGNELISITSIPNGGISEVCYPEQLEKVK